MQNCMNIFNHKYYCILASFQGSSITYKQTLREKKNGVHCLHAHDRKSLGMRLTVLYELPYRIKTETHS